MPDASPTEFNQNADGVILKVPLPKTDEADQVIVLTLTKGN
jgi:hypothetical protein